MDDYRYWGQGGCAGLAFALKNNYPHLKLGGEWVEQPGTTPEIAHVWAYDEDKNTSHDWRGAHEGLDGAAHHFAYGRTQLDLDPEFVAKHFNMEWTPDDPWADEDVNRADELIGDGLGGYHQERGA